MSAFSAVESYRVYFGGSFSPPHLGHTEIICDLVGKKECRTLHLVPTAQNPLKQGPNQYAFIQEWLLDLKEQLAKEEFHKIVLEDIEMLNSGPGYTHKTLELLKKKYDAQKEKWVMVLGSDSLKSLPLWFEIESLLLALDQLWVYQREGETTKMSDLPLKLSSLTQFKALEKRIPQVSSTELRKFIAAGNAGQEFLKKHLSPRVYQALFSMLS